MQRRTLPPWPVKSWDENNSVGQAGFDRMLEHNHYERAAAAWLRSGGHAFVPVHERQRAFLGSGETDAPSTVKSPDFLLLGTSGTSYVVDVKGRRHPGGSSLPAGNGEDRAAFPGPWQTEAKGCRRAGGAWESWVTLDDLDGLGRWSGRLGPGWEGLFLFAYWLDESFYAPDGADLFRQDGKRYLFRCALLSDFRLHMRVRSNSWGTVDLPARAARQVVRPLGDLAGLAPVGPFSKTRNHGVCR